jgi:phospholipid-binding lipoprotein MlaA
MVRRRLAVAAVLCAGFLMAAVSTAAESQVVEPSASDALDVYDPLFDDDELESIDERSDPFETGNQFLVPQFARRGVNRFFANLNSPVSFTNELLQLRPRAAGVTLARFVSNTTIGVGGLFDPADVWFGLSPHESDFGQTLARYGIPSGPYLVVPLFGPSTARDAFGDIIDQALNPLAYIAGPLNLQWRLLAGGGQGLSLKDSTRAQIMGLRGSSVDFYAALRSAYLQNRHALEREARGLALTEENGAP